MLKKLLISSILCVSSINLLIARDYGTATQTLDPTYISQMDQAIQKAESHVQDLLKNATRRDVVPTWASKVELENAIMQLEVKKTLVEKFRGAASLQSPDVRGKLMQILNKESIDESDLAELQNYVNKYKESLNDKPQSQPVKQEASILGATGIQINIGS